MVSRQGFLHSDQQQTQGHHWAGRGPAALPEGLGLQVGNGLVGVQGAGWKQVEAIPSHE